MTAIDRFAGPYAFLSNFYPAKVAFEGVEYQTVEHAYQAAKSLSMHVRRYVGAATSPAIAKRRGRGVELRDDWEEIKVSVMTGLVRQKFLADPLRSLLAATTPLELVENNHWNDRFWGVCNGLGENYLGRILMQVREEILRAATAAQ